MFSTRKVKFTDIIEIKHHKVIRTAKSGRITDGFTESILTLKSSDNLIISPDEYENYDDLMREIKTKILQLHEA